MQLFRWLKRMAWRKKRTGVFYRSGGGAVVCLPAGCRFTHRVLDLELHPASSPLPKGLRSVYFRFQVATRCLGPSRILLEIYNQVDRTESVSRLSDKPENGLIGRLRFILSKAVSRN